MLQPREARTYCVEPIAVTHARLQNAQKVLGWNNFHVQQAAVSDSTGTLYLPKQTGLGTENQGIAHFNNHCRANPGNCMEIPQYSLDDYVDTFVQSNKQGKPIHVLSIDVEGFDFEVLKSGNRTLPNVYYMEFEVHSVGLWSTHKLKDAIDLVSEYGFVCYWLGKNELWRINGCYRVENERKTWSNVGCVNSWQEEALPLLLRMEHIFGTTIQ